jgi:hypothetical protein
MVLEVINGIVGGAHHAHLSSRQKAPRTTFRAAQNLTGLIVNPVGIFFREQIIDVEYRFNSK